MQADQGARSGKHAGNYPPPPTKRAQKQALIDVIERRQKERRRLVSCRLGSDTGATAFLSGRPDAVVRSRRPARLLPRFFLRSSTLRSFGHSRRVLFGAVSPWNFPLNSSPTSPPICLRSQVQYLRAAEAEKPGTGSVSKIVQNHSPKSCQIPLKRSCTRFDQ